MDRRGSTAKKIAVLALLSGLGLVAFLLEGLLPAVFVPGAKPGVANIFSLVALIMYSPLEAMAVVVVRTLLGAVFAGNVSALLYSFTGGTAAILVASVLIYTAHPRVSVTAVSIVSATVHNIVQNVVFVFISGTAQAFGYMPYLILLGVLSGAVVGALTTLLFRGVPISVFEKLILEKMTENKA